MCLDLPIRTPGIALVLLIKLLLFLPLSGEQHSAVIIKDEVDGPYQDDPFNAWHRAGSVGAAFFSPERHGVTPLAGGTFWSVYRQDPTARPEPAGARMFFEGETFSKGTYTATFYLAKGPGWEWPDPRAYLIVDVTGDGSYHYFHRVPMHAVSGTAPEGSDWERWVFELEVDETTVTQRSLNGPTHVLGKGLGFLVVASVKGGEGYAFDQLEISFTPQNGSKPQQPENVRVSQKSVGITRKKLPNIIFVMADDMGWADLGVYGSKVTKTPHLDRLAHQGILFTDAYAGAPLCAPSRSTLLTGQHTGRTPVRGNLGGTPLPENTVTFASILQEAGYTIGGFGKWGLGEIETTGVPEKQGFDEFFGYYHQVHAHVYYTTRLFHNSVRIEIPGNVGFHTNEGGVSHDHPDGLEPVYSPYLIHEKTLNFISENSDQPFFCYVPLAPPHRPFQIPEDDPAWALYKDKDWPEAAKAFAAMNSMIDRQVGEIVQLLEELGIAEQTLIIFTSDNGAARRWASSLNSSGPLRGAKRELSEGGIRVPFIAYWPGTVEAGQESNLLTYFPDMLPTFAELAGLSHLVPSDIDGISIVPTLLGEEAAGRAQEIHPFLYWENATTDYSNQRYLWPETLVQAARIGPWKAFRPRPDASIRIFNLDQDIGETNDLAAEHPDLVSQFEEIFLQESIPPKTDQGYSPRRF